MPLRLPTAAAAAALLLFALPAAAEETPAAQCDALTGNPDDPNHVGAGVRYDDIDIEKAIPACEAAVQAEPDTVRLRYQLGRALDKAGKPEQAAEHYRATADKGYLAGINSLGLLYESGEGVAKDPAEALRLYRQAAEQGYAPAIGNVAYAYENGIGTKQDMAEAARWYQQAAEKGDDWSQNQLGNLYRNGIGVAKDEAQAVRWFKASADQDNPTAMANLAGMYAQGVGGLTKDPAEAFRLAKRSSEMGDSYGHYQLGRLYDAGEGVAQDLKEAERLYRMAAEQNEADAQNALAWNIVTRGGDLAEARTLAEKAAKRFPDAGYIADTLAWIQFKQGEAEAAANTQERAIALQPDQPSFYERLGDIYAGLGRREDARKAWQRAIDLSATPGPDVLEQIDVEAVRKKLQEG